MSKLISKTIQDFIYIIKLSDDNQLNRLGKYLYFEQQKRIKRKNMFNQEKDIKIRQQFQLDEFENKCKECEMFLIDCICKKLKQEGYD